MRIIAFLQLFPPLLYLFALAYKGGSIHAQAAGGVPYIAVAAVRPPNVADLQLLHQPVQVHLLKVLLAILLADGDVIGDGQLLRLDDIVLGNDHHALHHIVQLPYIAGPVVALHADDGLRGEALFLVIFLVHFGGIGRHNVGNILPALPQRR